jgi:CubicO group peptidase (beta-lactamase class C family)
LLADRGVLSVDDPVGSWLDDCPPAWDPITVHHLLSHSAGLAHWPGLPGLEVTRPMATDQKLRTFAAAPLLSRPGERYSYSSPGYVLLAHIIERATGKPYGAFLAEEIFEPLGMAATFNGHPSGQAGLAVGRHDGTPVPSFDLDTLGLGTGSIWSTVGDLTRWDRALANGDILSEAARQAMFTVHVPVEDDDGLVRTEGYGYGWFIGSVSGGPDVLPPRRQPRLPLLQRLVPRRWRPLGRAHQRRNHQPRPNCPRPDPNRLPMMGQRSGTDSQVGYRFGSCT